MHGLLIAMASQVVLVVKGPPAKAGDVRDSGSIPGSGPHLGGNGNPLQYSCLENPMDKGAWWATIYRVEKSRTRLKRLSTLGEHRSSRKGFSSCDTWSHCRMQLMGSRARAQQLTPHVESSWTGN